MADECTSVHIWVGMFASQQAFEAYFAETYTEDDEHPISAFARDLDQSFYDHDFVEHSYSDEGSVKAMLATHSFSSSYLAEVLRELGHDRVHRDNSVVLAWAGADIVWPRWVAGEGYELRYVGRFSCDPDAVEAGRLTPRAPDAGRSVISARAILSPVRPAPVSAEPLDRWRK